MEISLQAKRTTRVPVQLSQQGDARGERRQKRVSWTRPQQLTLRVQACWGRRKSVRLPDPSSAAHMELDSQGEREVLQPAIMALRAYLNN